MIKFTGTLPEYQTEESTGADLCTTEDFTIGAGEIKVVPTGLFIENSLEGLSEYYDVGTARLQVDIQIRPRSGLAAKYGITVLNSPGSIDLDYRQEIKVILFNQSNHVFEIPKGTRIAQLVVGLALRVPQFPVKQVTRTGGFGSTNS